MKKLINGMIMVLLAVFMLVSNADASAWDLYGTVIDAPEGTQVRIWRINCGSMILIGVTTSGEDGNYEFNSLGKGEYVIAPFNDGVTFDPSTRSIRVPQSKVIDFVVVE
jgi:hypothetical protein